MSFGCWIGTFRCKVRSIYISSRIKLCKPKHRGTVQINSVVVSLTVSGMVSGKMHVEKWGSGDDTPFHFLKLQCQCATFGFSERYIRRIAQIENHLINHPIVKNICTWDLLSKYIFIQTLYVYICVCIWFLLYMFVPFYQIF